VRATRPSGADPSIIPADAPCCPLRGLDSNGCSWCFSDDVETTLTCSLADPNGRRSEQSCSYSNSFGDAGLDGAGFDADAAIVDAEAPDVDAGAAD
jgi:hypothetical protein